MSYEQRPSIIDLIFEYESALASDHLTFFAEETYCQLIDYYLEDQQVDRAMEAVERALTHHPFSADFSFLKLIYFSGFLAFLAASFLFASSFDLL